MFETTIAGSLPKPFWLSETNKLWPQWKANGPELDAAKRNELYHQILSRARDQAYFVFLLNYKDLYGMSKRLKWEPRSDQQMLISEMTFR